MKRNFLIQLIKPGNSKNIPRRQQQKKMALLYLRNCLTRSDVIIVAQIDGEPAGLISWRITGTNKKHFLRFILWMTSLIKVAVTKEGRKMLEYSARLEESNDKLLFCDENIQNYGAEISLFIIDERYRGLNIGRKLLEDAEKQMKRAGVQRYYLFTDTQCNYGFYDHMGLIRSNELKETYFVSGKSEELVHFLYEGQTK